MAATITDLVNKILNSFTEATSKPELFLSVQEPLYEQFKAITKDLYSLGQQYPLKGFTESLPELLVDGFDEEQIWQQIELRNKSIYDVLLKNTARLIAKNKRLDSKTTKTTAEEVNDDNAEIPETDDESVCSDLSIEVPDDSEEEISDDGNSEDLKFDEFQALEDEDDSEPLDKKREVKKTPRKTAVDDEFFKLGEMEEFLQKEEQRDRKIEKGDSDAESIDFFEDIPSEDEDDARNAKYGDFFKSSKPRQMKRTTKQNEEGLSDMEESGEKEDSEEESEDTESESAEKRVKFDLGSEESSEDESLPKNKSKQKSQFELREERLKAKIKELEEEALAPKSWQLLGEAKADTRPENALLEEDLLFDHTTRQAPVITEETTKTLEDIIRQRIKDQAFDDVERKVKPANDPGEYKKKLVLDQEKSKFSLAELYEQEYLKKQEEAHKQQQPSSLADPLRDQKTEDDNHIEIGKRMSSLFSKLEALSNFHYTPRMPAPEIKIVTNMPSIVMEEIAPVTVSDANLLAPEEVQDHVKRDVKGSSEKENTDRLRERRGKKLRQRQRHKEKERLAKTVDKINPGMGNKHAKLRVLQSLEKAEKDGTVTLIKDNKNRAVKSSTAFFKQLQEEVTTQVKTTKTKGSQKNKKISGIQLKL